MSKSSTSKELRVVQMLFAYEWQCPCGYKSYVSAEPVKLRPAQVLAYVQKHGGTAKAVDDIDQGYLDGEFITHPKTVVCENCGEKFTCKTG